MKKILERISYILIGVVLTVVVGSSLVIASSAEPGTDVDPLISMGYLEVKLAEINNKIDSLFQENKVVQYEVMKLEVGNAVVLGASTEFIIRSGEVSAVGSESGGLADLTSGVDLKTGDIVPTNHSIVIAKDDGRGFIMLTEGWVMIKGTYTIK